MMNDESISGMSRHSDRGDSSFRVQHSLFLGLFLVFLAFWKGNGGYHDLVTYMDAAEGLWLRGSLRLPQEPLTPEREDELRATAANPREFAELIEAETRPEYNKYSIGLPILSGPFVLAGALVERASGGRITTRQIAALTVPILGVLACLLIFEIGLLLRQSSRVSFWAALVFALGSPLLTYVRQYFAEVAVIFCVLLALWAFIKSFNASETAGLGWVLLAGAGLAGATVCHYAQVVLSAVLWAAFVAALFFTREMEGRRATRVLALTAVPVIAGAGLLWLNYSRYGHPLRTGGYAMDVETQLRPENIAANILFSLQWLFRTPWLPAALVITASVALRPTAPRRLSGESFPPVRIVCAGLFLAFLAQDVFWLSYEPLGYSPLRYQQPLTALCAVGLIGVGAWLFSRFGTRGLLAAIAALLVWNVCVGTLPLAAASNPVRQASPLIGDTFAKSFSFLSGDDSHSRPFLIREGGVWCYVWYMVPFPPEMLDGYGTPMGVLQWALLTLQLGTGSLLLAIGWRQTAMPLTKS